jgi:hypothetical protein
MFIGIQLKLGDIVYDAWEQAGAGKKNREKLTTILFQKRVSFKRQFELFDEGSTICYEMVAFSERYVKPKDTRIKTRQMTFPGAPPPDKPVRMPVELRKNWGDCWRQEYLVEDVTTGVKTKQAHDPTQRHPTTRTEDIDAAAMAKAREIHGPAFERSVTWVGPSGGTEVGRPDEFS